MDSRVSVITIGAATVDVFLAGEALAAKRDVKKHKLVEEFPLGGKFELDHLYFDTGGGASNAAVTFARQGFKTAFAGRIGRDLAGGEVIRVLKREGIGTEHLAYDDELGTGYSTLLLAPSGERTVLLYRGASHNLQKRDFDIASLKADWLYITSVAGNFDLLTALIKHAAANQIKVAINPGQMEIDQPKKLKTLLGSVSLVLANKDEYQAIYGGENYRSLLKAASAVTPLVVLTDGPRGAFASDSQTVSYVGEYHKVKVLDRTGAGDAFCSGFVATIARGGTLAEALTFGSANATSVVQQIGAKAGILTTKHVRSTKVKTTTL